MRRVIAILALGSTLFAASAIAAIGPAHQATLDKIVRYLQEAQEAGGGFGGAGEPSQITSAWTALGLAAAGINPQDQARPSGTDAFSYLASHYQEGIEESECAPITCTTTLERELMVVNSAGANPHDFAGVDLMGELLARAQPDGSFPHVPGGEPGVNDTIFAIFALVPVEEPAAQAAVQPAADWIEAAQLDNGGWAFSAGNSRDEVDMTGAAVQALVAAGRETSDAARKGMEYLRAAQNPDGGFPEYPGNPESNVASTAWATQAIWAVGENPEDWRSGSSEATEEPLDYMASLQQPDGHIRWKRSQDLNGIWMTAYVAPAFAGRPWPIRKLPRALKAPPPQQGGDGGEGAQSGAGVIAGGGGRGAPLFSRPKPQSRGKTPGGARVVGNGKRPPVDHSETRRGENKRQPTGTVTKEAESGESQLPAVASSAAAGGGSGGGSGATDASRAGSADSSAAASAAANDPGGSPAARALAAEDGGSKSAGDAVTGTLVGTAAASGGELAFGAPGLHGAGVDPDSPPWTAVGIAAAALVLALAGARLERRREWAFPGTRA